MSHTGEALMPMFKRGCVVLVTIALAACSGRSTPSSPTSPTTTPTVVDIEITGGNSFPRRLTAPGQTTQLSAIAVMSDGSLRDVTWQSRNSSVAIVSQTGLVTAVDLGLTYIDVNIPENIGNERTGSDVTIFVGPEGTYILLGECVQDPDQQCLADARVEILGGPMSGLATMTDQGGNWRFFHTSSQLDLVVSGVLQVRVSKEGYITAVQDVPQPGDPRTVEIGLCGPVLAPVGNESTTVAPVCLDDYSIGRRVPQTTEPVHRPAQGTTLGPVRPERRTVNK
jgi:Bacterial Ig-like domain (group 2)